MDVQHVRRRCTKLTSTLCDPLLVPHGTPPAEYSEGQRLRKKTYSTDLQIAAGNIAITTASATRSYTHLQNGTFALAGHFLEAHAFMLVSLVFALASALDFLIYVT